jgi:IS5 family transposase
MLVSSLNVKESELGAIGYTVPRLLMCLILQFMENLSDREFQRFMEENTAGKWFCGFSLMERTPDYSTFCKFRNKLGTDEIEKLFNAAREQLKAKGYLREIFTFIDATALICKLQMWDERDKAISDGYEKFNNEVIERYANDKDVRIGAKSKNKFWIGFKKFLSLDMGSGMINRVKVSAANVPDNDVASVSAILPSYGAVNGDKGFVGAIPLIEQSNCHSMIILKNNMKEKNRDKDRFLTKLRSPFEGVFSKQEKRTRYKGTLKNQVSEFLYSMAHNFRRLIVLEEAST